MNPLSFTSPNNKMVINAELERKQNEAAWRILGTSNKN
jgi:hypothetical protein